MNYKTLKLSFILLIGLGVSSLKAQDAVTTSGGSAIGTGGSASYSVGQVFYTNSTGANGSVSEGVQQPYEISVILGLENTTDISLKCSTYPNPTIDNVNLKIENYKSGNMNYKLFDINGKLISSNDVKNSETRIDMNQLLPATYFLKINQNGESIKTFKIIKN